MKAQLQASNRRLTATPPGPYQDLLLANEVRDWNDLEPGDRVQVRIETGITTRTVVDTINEDGSIIWLRNEPFGHRSLHLRADPLTLYMR